MTEPTEGTGARFSSFKLDHDIEINGQVIHPAGTEVRVRKPKAGELRGIDISATIGRCDYAQIEKLAPRVTTPVLHKEHVAAMEADDFTQLGGEIVDFLLPRAVKQAASPNA